MKKNEEISILFRVIITLIFFSFVGFVLYLDYLDRMKRESLETEQPPVQLPVQEIMAEDIVCGHFRCVIYSAENEILAEVKNIESFSVVSEGVVYCIRKGIENP